MNVFAGSLQSSGLQTVLKDAWLECGDRPLFAWHEEEPKQPDLALHAKLTVSVWVDQLALRQWWLSGVGEIRDTLVNRTDPEVGWRIRLAPDGEGGYTHIRVDALRLPWVSAGVNGKGPTAAISNDRCQSE